MREQFCRRQRSLSVPCAVALAAVTRGLTPTRTFFDPFLPSLSHVIVKASYHRFFTRPFFAEARVLAFFAPAANVRRAPLTI